MTRSLTWLHLSDLHARQRSDWDSRQVTDSLVHDLKAMQKEHGLRPDFVFITGDLAFGAVDRETMADQYQLVRNFLDAVRTAFEPEIPIRDLYLVPGNHDVDRGEITPDQTDWLRKSSRQLSEILGAMGDGKKQWRTWMERLANYRHFLTGYGLLHLVPNNLDQHLIWADEREIADIRVGIAGLNSAWSCAGQDEKGKLWLGSDWQIAQIKQNMGPVNFTFALVHHPGSWFTPLEGPNVMRRLRQEFAIVLHGHEHDDWVDVDSDGRLVLSAGACYNSSWMSNGYSFGRLDLDQSHGEVRLRQWDANGRGWVPRNIAGKTQDGLWSLQHLPWLTTSAQDTASSEPTFAQAEPPPSIGESAVENYTRRYCKHVMEQHDVLELFGCDIPRELKRHQLSVAYVSLNVAPEDDDSFSCPTPKRPTKPFAKPNRTEGIAGPQEEEIDTASTTIDYVLDKISAGSKRLLINGPAGAGKSTLLRWCSIQSAQQILSDSSSPTGPLDNPATHKRLTNRDGYIDDSPTSSQTWRQKIPFLIRLRDCPTGRLPAANDLPSFLAKHLPSAPQSWITDVLDSGKALVLFDGVDEIHRDQRPQLAEEIGELIRTYQECIYVITTRPGAVEPGWLDREGFTEAHVEPMSRRDREEFIDKWYRSAAQELKLRPRPGEDLTRTASQLKRELVTQPELGLLATNPLLCAMICALYRERQEKLPETPAELSEALCQMLLHRRERETPGLSDKHFLPTWRALTYPQKKELLAELAWHMVSKGDSSIETSVTTSLVAESLDSTPGRRKEEAEEVVQALVERSGLLRPASDGRIDFLHNTLKEYLAAGRVVDIGEWKLLADHAGDPAWQPVILFSLALAPEPFSSGLVGKLMEQISSTKPQTKKTGNLTKQERKALATGKARQFFLVRCRAAAKRLAADLSTTIDGFLEHLLPPASMNEVEALAQIGHRILPYAAKSLKDRKWSSGQSCRMLARHLRLLRLIGGPQAKAILETVHSLPSYATQVNNEWLLASCELSPEVPLLWPFSQREAVTRLELSSSAIRDISPVAQLTSLRTLNLGRTWVTSLDPLKGLKSLESLWLFSTPVRDLSPLSGLTSLNELDLSWSHVHDLSPLNELRSLRELWCFGTRVSSLSSLAGLMALETLYLSSTQVSDLGPLTGLHCLKSLSLARSRITDLSPLGGLISLEYLGVSGTEVSDLSPLAGLTSLESLDLSETGVSDLRLLKGLSKLKNLYLKGVPVTDLSPLAGLTTLEFLNLVRTPVTDLSPLVPIVSLKQIAIDKSSNGEAIERFKFSRPDVTFL